MRKKTLIALLLFSFTFLTGHDLVINSVDHHDYSLKELVPNHTHYSTTPIHNMHEHIDNIVMHFDSDLTVKPFEPVKNECFRFDSRYMPPIHNSLERPPNA